MIFASIMIIPLLYYLTMVIWMPRNALERCQFLLGLAIFTVIGPFINIGVTVYAVKNMDNFGWGKTRKVISETGEAEEVNADDQQMRIGEALEYNEKAIGSQVSDEENQRSRIYTPYTVEPPKPRARSHPTPASTTIRRDVRRRPNSYDTSATPFPDLSGYALSSSHRRVPGHGLARVPGRAPDRVSEHRPDSATIDIGTPAPAYLHALSDETRDLYPVQPISVRRMQRMRSQRNRAIFSDGGIPLARHDPNTTQFSYIQFP